MTDEQGNTLQQEIDTFHRNSGEILRLALGIESCLDFFISNYFCHPQNYKTFLFSDVILVESPALSFERKIQIFKEICKEESVNQSIIRNICNAISFVKNIRNRIAHGEAYISGLEGVKLQKRRSKLYKKDELKITDELVHKVDEKRLFCIQEINKIYMELSSLPKTKNHNDRF
jgi:hypothetical protein